MRKYGITKKRGLPEFNRHIRSWEKKMVSSSATPMLIDHPFDDSKKGEKSSAKRKASKAFLKILR